MSEFQPTSILCPTDFSPFSEMALQYAIAIARQYQARLHLIHADTFLPPWQFTAHDVGMFVQQIEEARQATRRSLARYVEERTHGIEAEAHLIEDTPTQAILNAAERYKADLIVMGTHGRGGLNRLLLGSVTEKVVRQARVPVIVVREPLQEAVTAQEPGIPHKILCPVNFTQTAYEALQLATSMAAQFDARLTVLVAEEDKQKKPSTPEEIRKRLCAGVSEETLSRCHLEMTVRQGNAAEEIIRHAQEEKTDLIIIGGQRTTFFEGIVMGSTTVRVMRHAPCPVLIVPCCD